MSADPPPSYVEHRPAPALARHVECYWSVTGRLPRDTTVAGRVLPDGCMDIVLSLGDPPLAGGCERAGAVAVGSMTKPLEVRYGGTVRVIGVRFRPGGAPPYLAVPAAELTDRSVPLEEIWSAAARKLQDRLGETPPELRPRLLDEVLLHRLERSPGVDERVLAASEAVAERGGAVRVDRLADAVGLGTRQLERRFLACVGVTPKVAARVARFRSVVARMHADPLVPLSRLAIEAGYADQAHLSREFRALADSSPAAYLRGRRPGAERSDG